MAKKASKKKVGKKSAKGTRPQPRKRSVTLGVPSKSIKTVKAESDVSPPASAAVAGGESVASNGGVGKIVNSAEQQEDGSIVVVLTRTITKDEVVAILSGAAITDAEPAEICEQVLDYCHDAVNDAVAETEADAESEHPRYQSDKPAPESANAST